jgi:hypothetical protein
MSLLECLNKTAVTPSSGEPKVAHCIEPLQDRRWDEFVHRHPRASVFHCSAWLEALSRTYGYKPIAYTTSPAGQELENGMVFCRVESWLTGRRLVSLPFSDHCELLVDTEEDLEALSALLDQEFRRERWRYVELRPLGRFDIKTSLCHTSVAYTFHQLDLDPDLDTLFGNFHKSSIQRKIRRAEREGLRYCEGSSEPLLDHFYALFTLTRKRHKLPPQPRKWFANLMECFGDALKIRVAFKDDRPVAAIMTICHKSTMVYKYGCSDPRFSNLGSTQLLYWKAIQDAKNSGFRFFDLGRTDTDQQGLITFKNRWSAAQSSLNYSRYGNAKESTHSFDLTTSKWNSRAAKYVLAHLPMDVLSMAGRVLYRHSG